MTYAALVGAIVAVAALALERLAAAAGRPRRIAWLAALTLAALIPLTAGLRRQATPAVTAAGEPPELVAPAPEARWTIVPELPLPTNRDTTRTANIAVLLQAGARSQARWGLALAMGQPKSLLERRLKTMSEKPMMLNKGQAVLLSVAALVALAIACDAPAPTRIEEAGDRVLVEAQSAESARRDKADSRLAGIFWEDPPVVEWDRVRLYPLSTVTYQDETPVEFANKLLALDLSPGLREYDAGLRAEAIEVDADRIRVEGDRLVVRGGSVRLGSAEKDDESWDGVFFRITGGSQGGSWSIFLFNHLGIVIPSSEAELIEDVRAFWRSREEGAG